jgi:hypothetical protein
MAKLNIHLQEGFRRDEVIITHDGREIYHNPSATTHPMHPLADEMEYERGDGPLTLTVSIPNRGISRKIELEAGSPPNLGLYIDGGKIEHRTSEKAFAYM